MEKINREKQLTDIRDLTYDELTIELREMGEPAYRAGQIYKWLHVKLVSSFDQMSDLSKDLRKKLEDKYMLYEPEAVDRQISRKDGVQKFLFRLFDGQMIESVWMPYKHGNSVCISSQAGCRMGCSFCASTIGGLIRNLTPAEMLGQIYAITRITGERVSNVVVMGTGEPLDNYDNLIRFIRMLTDERGLNISQRNVTVSTCGLADKIIRLSEEGLQITLALSLHASSDEKRQKIMPVAKSYSIEELMKAAGIYFEKTGRRITFEYSLIDGVNNSDEDAKELARLARRISAHVNLIPVNPVRETAYRPPDRRAAEEFKQKLEKQRVNATIRRTLGEDIDAACGQLRRKSLQ